MATMREAFEAWFSSNGEWPNAVKRSNGGEYLLSQAATAWNVWQAAHSSRDEQVRILREVSNQILLEEGMNPGTIPGDIVAGAREAIEATKEGA